MSATYFGILTKYGEEREAQAHALGIPLKITSLSVGDGGGVVPTPDRLQTAVIGEWRRKPLNQLSTDLANPNWLIAEQVIPENEGGNWIRTLGLHDDTGALVAVANCPPTYKPLLAEGSGRTQVIRMVLMVSSATNFELKIDPAVVLATRKYADDGLALKLDKTGIAVAAAKLSTARTIALTGDATASTAFDGTKNVSAALTLAASGVTAGTAGGANEIPVITVDAKGRVTVLGKVAVGNAATATKLAAARQFSITGGATAAGVNFDGSANVSLNVTALDVSKANAGILPVPRGGTGLATVPVGSFLAGAGANAMNPRTPAQVLEDIQALPKTGGDVSGPVLLGAGSTIGSEYGTTTIGKTAHILLPDGGGFSSNVGTVPGAMKITLPPASLNTNTMLRLRVEVFEYATDLPVTILINGYVQTTKAWVRTSATIIAGSVSSDFPIRFGNDAAGTPCIWIGDVSKGWLYPTVTVAEVLAKYNANGATVAAWGVNWKVEPVTAFETVSSTLSSGNLAFGRTDVANVAGLQDALVQKANAGLILTAGNGLTGGGTLGANRTITLGTPEAITADSQNSVSVAGHTHQLALVPADIGAAPTTLNLTAGNGLTGGGSLAANRSFALGTPGTLTANTTNAVQATSHTHLLDTQASANDATAGRILTVGAFGLGADNPLGTADLDTILIPGKYGQSQNANATPARHYPANKAGSLEVGMAGAQITTQCFVVYDTGEMYTRGRYNAVWSDWCYHPGLGRFPNAAESTAGILKLATIAQAQGLLDDTTALTPKKLADAFKGANSQVGARGFMILPNGWILQLLTVQNTNGVDVYNLPIPFPNVGLYAWASGQTAWDNLTGASVFVETFFNGRTQVGVKVVRADGTLGQRGVSVLAIGY